jgi:hypothetical protein
MPDLNVTAVWTCRSNVDWQKEVVGSNGDRCVVRFSRLYGRELHRQGVMYGHTCTCKGFEVRGRCRHVEALKTERCGWNGEFEPTAQCNYDESGQPCCPMCGGPVEAVSVGV